MSNELQELYRKTTPDGGTMIAVRVQGDLGEEIRRYYGKPRDEVKILHHFPSEGDWSATLIVGNYTVHSESGEGQRMVFRPLNGATSWKVQLAGGQRLLRHVLRIAGRG